MAHCSPGCVSAISGRGTSLDPGPVTIASAGANHGCRIGCVAGVDETGWAADGWGARYRQSRARL